MGFYNSTNSHTTMFDWFFSMSGLISLGFAFAIGYGIYMILTTPKAKKSEEELHLDDPSLYDDFKTREEVQAEMREARIEEANETDAETLINEERAKNNNNT